LLQRCGMARPDVAVQFRDGTARDDREVT
jgi:hypothetical protein